MSSGTNKERIIQNNELIQNNNNKLNVLANKVSTLSVITDEELTTLNTIADTILGNTEMIEPIDYIIGEIANSGIDTGVNSSSKVKIQVKLLSTVEQYNYTIGWWNTSESKAFRFFNPGSIAMLDYGSGAGYNRIEGGTFKPNVIYEFELGNRYIKNLGTNQILAQAGAITFDHDKSLQIVECNIWYLKIYEDDVLVRDYIPAKDKVTNKVGLLDKLTNTFNTGWGNWREGRN